MSNSKEESSEIRVQLQGHADVAQALLEHDTGRKECGLETALAVAAGCGHETCVHVLLAADAKKTIDAPGADDVLKWTPLMRAAKNGHT